MFACFAHGLVTHELDRTGLQLNRYLHAVLKPDLKNRYSIPYVTSPMDNAEQYWKYIIIM